MDWSEAAERWDALGYTQGWVSEQLTNDPRLARIMDVTSTTKLSRAAKDKKPVPLEVVQWLLALTPKLGKKQGFDEWLAKKAAAAAQVVPAAQTPPQPAQAVVPAAQTPPQPAQTPPQPAQAAIPAAQGTTASVQGRVGEEIVIQPAKDAVSHHVTVNIVHESKPVWGLRPIIAGLVLMLAGSLLWNFTRPTSRHHHPKTPARSQQQEDLSPDSDSSDEETESDSDSDSSNPDDLYMPETPPKGQARPPCPSAQDVVANGACWIGPLKGKSPPCGKGRYALQGECYAPDPERRKPRPNAEGARDGGR